MSDVCCMFIDPLFNRSTYFPSVWDNTGAGNKVDPFQILRVNRVFNRSKRISNDIERLE